jgi:hypothetical protein
VVVVVVGVVVLEWWLSYFGLLILACLELV